MKTYTRYSEKTPVAKIVYHYLDTPRAWDVDKMISTELYKFSDLPPNYILFVRDKSVDDNSHFITLNGYKYMSFVDCYMSDFDVDLIKDLEISEISESLYTWKHEFIVDVDMLQFVRRHRYQCYQCQSKFELKCLAIRRTINKYSKDNVVVVKPTVFNMELAIGYLINNYNGEAVLSDGWSKNMKH